MTALPDNGTPLTAGQEQPPTRVGRFVVLVLAVYAAAWHVSFLAVFVMRGEALDAALYRKCLVTMLKPGPEIPNSITLWAIVLTAGYFVVRTVLHRLFL